MKYFALYINGLYVQSKEHFAMNEPWQCQKDPPRLAILKKGNPEDQEVLEAALDGAEMSFRQIRKGFFTLRERLEFLKRFQSKLLDQQANLARLMTQETGKPYTLCLSELARAHDTLSNTLECGENFFSSHFVTSPKGFESSKASYTREARGVLLAITPFNYPINLLMHKVAPAIAAGCPIILKPSPKSQLSTLTLIDFMHACELPPGMLNMIQIENEEVKRVFEDPRIAQLSFTGSSPVGWGLVSNTTKPYTLELGGNAPVYVDRSANLETAAKKIVAGAFNHCGQICISVQNITIDAAIEKPFKELLKAETEKFPFGNPFDPRTLAGPTVDEGAHVRLSHLRQDLLAKGARSLAQSKNLIESAESFMSPVEAKVSFNAGAANVSLSAGATGAASPLLLVPELFENIPLNHAIYHTEIFGPYASVDTVAHFEEWLERVNRNSHRLQAGVFSKDEALIARACSELDYGGVLINESPAVRFDPLPYGGRGLAGRGREGAQFAMEEYTELKAIIQSPS